MTDFQSELDQLPPRPKLTRGLPSTEERIWFQKHYLGLFPRDGVDLMKRFRRQRAENETVPNAAE